MAVMEMSGEQDIMKLWHLVIDLSEQLSQMRQAVSSLHAESQKLKLQAVHNETGFVLRRYNTHLSQEEYETELERMNAAVAVENQSLQYDNKQLNSLLKEYEQTLESVMSSFRKRAHDVQLHELEMIRQYETLLTSSESEAMKYQLAADCSVSLVVAQCSRRLRTVLRLLGGEDPISPSLPLTPPLSPKEEEGKLTMKVFETRCAPELFNPSTDWALEREIELARLEKENEELRMLLQAGAQADSVSSSATLPLQLPRIPLSAVRQSMPRRSRMRTQGAFHPETTQDHQAGHYQNHESHQEQEMVDISGEVL